MTLKRPEGLSPCYLSLVSPDIAESQIFSWTFRGATSKEFQGSFTIKIYDANKTVLRTYSGTGRTMYCNVSDIGYSFQLGQTYYWTVQCVGESGVSSDISVYAKFYYDSCPISPSISWTYIPKAGDVIVKDTYFAEFKSNLLAILGDYDSVPSSLTSSVSRLFSGEVVPNRKDFDTFQDIVTYLSETLEGTKDTLDIYDLVSDSLGVSDLEKIRNYITSLLSIAPKPMEKIDITANFPGMYTVSGVTASSSGKEDTTINLSWSTGSIEDETGNFVFTKVSPSKDVRYYTVSFEYGPKNTPFLSVIYFKESELSDGTSRSFDMNWDGLYDSTNLSQAEHALKVETIDHRGNISVPITITQTYGSNFKIPMGVDHYEIQYQKGTLTTTTYTVGGTWTSLSNTTNKSIVHTVSGASGKFFYRVRAVDETGLKTDWSYSGGVTFDPLKPPGVPQNLHVTSVGVTDAAIAWNAVPTAETYEVNRYRYNFYGDSGREGKDWADQTATNKSDSGLAANSIYNYFVRAKNRAGVSDWAVVNVHTDRPTHTSYYTNVHCHTWADSGVGWYHDQGVHHTYAYSGKWSGANTRGQWYFPYEQMRQDLDGAEIVSVRIAIARLDGGYSSTPYKPKFYMHNVSTADWSQNHSEVPVVYGSGAYGDVTFKAGERKWTALPNNYIESIRDGHTTGIMLHNPSGTPAMKFDTGAQIEVTYKK
jgi:hypothetical protein